MNQQEIRPSISRRANRKDKLSLRRRGCFNCRLSVGSNLTTSNKKTACVCEEWENIAERCQSNRTHTHTEQRKYRNEKYRPCRTQRCERCHSSPVDLLLDGLYFGAGDNTITHSGPPYPFINIRTEPMCAVPQSLGRLGRSYICSGEEKEKKK